jgi:hypothetical protein
VRLAVAEGAIPLNNTSNNFCAARSVRRITDKFSIAIRAFQLPALLRHTSPRKRLWQLAGALSLLIVSILAMNPLLAREKRVTPQLLGHDFLAFYTAGTFAREHRFEDLYNLDAVRQFQRQTATDYRLEVGQGFGPWWNPPFYAWAFAPLAMLPYDSARLSWFVVNLLALATSLMLLIDMLPKNPDGRMQDWRTWLLIPLLVLTSMPLIQALSHGQNTCTSLLLLCGTVAAWRARRGVLAGMIAGLLFYKPQLAAVLAIVMTMNLGRRAILGMAFTGGTLLLLTALTMPGMVGIYLRQLPLNVHFMQVENAYLWERHVTLKAFWRLLLMGRDAGEATAMVSIFTLAGVAIFGGGLLLAGLRCRRGCDDPWTGQTRALARDRLISATIVTSPLLMPFYFDYDLLLLAMPAVILAAEFIRREALTTPDRWLIRTWIALGAWLLINPGLARMSHVNVSTILLACLSVQLIVRACVGRSLDARTARPEPAPASSLSLRTAA